jgi:hypothetical protein
MPKWAGRGSVESRVRNSNLLQEEEKQFHVHIPGATGSRAGYLLDKLISTGAVRDFSPTS